MVKFHLGLLASVFIASASTVSAQTVYVIDKTHSTVRGCWSHFGVTNQCVYFTSAEGELVFNEAAPEASKLSITFPIDKLEGLSAVFNEHLKSDQWFDVKKYPVATFVSTKVEKLTNDTGRVTGNLTIKNLSKPVTLDVKLNFSGMHPYTENGLSLGFDAKGELKRSDFGVGAYAPAVSDTIKLDIQTEFNKKR